MSTSHSLNINKEKRLARRSEATKGFTGMLLVVGLIGILILVVLIFFLGKEALVQLSKFQGRPSSKVQTETISPTSSIPTVTPSLWKTYTNDKYNFELTYPAKGVIIKENGYEVGECGNSIDEETSGSEEKIFIDSFFDIRVIPWQGTLENYLRQKGAFEAYNFEAILDSGADEALDVKGLKSEVSYAVGYPPLRFISHIYKKGDKIFLIEDFHNSEYFGGCLNPKTLDPVKYAQVVNLEWDLKKSLKFLNEAQDTTEGKFCGGFAGILCLEGYTCKLDGDYPDAGGRCIKE